MNDIVLIFPLKFNKFYINPFYLQKIYTSIIEEKLPNISLQLLDINVKQFEQKLHTKQFELAIIDTPEGGTDSLINILNMVNAKTLLLVGDIIKYGKSQDLLECLHTIFAFTIYGCIDDTAIVKFIKKYLSKEKLEDVSGLIYFKNKMFIQNKIIDENIIYKHTKLYFTNDIIQLYESKGIQLFMDGISRGCENNCSFCKLNNNSLLKRKIEQSNIDIIKTISELSRKCKKTLFIQFTDENFFGGGIPRLKQILELSCKLKNIDFNGLIGIDTRLDSIYNSKSSSELNVMRKEVWNNFYKCGLRYCFLGLETFSKTQSFRYNKNLDLSNFDYAITFLKKRGIIYTIGLILWDPLMQKAELIENLKFIKDNNLLGQTASLLKIMRIQVNSQYYKKYFELTKNTSFDYFNIDEKNIEYKDPEIKKMLPFVQKIYHLFNDNGYRHSDVALFSVLYDKNTPQIFQSIPYIISEMEYDILFFLLHLNDFCEYRDILKTIYTRCHTTVTDINNSLKKIDINNKNLTSIKCYYDDVFTKIYNSLINDMKNLLLT